MSLNTRSEITENPSKQGVTAAASGKELEADIQRKMKLWGVIEAFRDGRMPSNRQIDNTLEYAIEHSPIDVSKLSPEGRVLVDDTRDILETLRMMVQEKNADELFQNAVYSSYNADPTVAKQGGVVPVSKEDAKADANQAAAHLRVLLTLFVTNSETRKLIKDLGFVGRDIFATAASRAADSARPTDEQLNQIDREAPSKEWIGADGKTHGAHETPEIQMKGPDGREIRYNPKDAPGQAKLTDADGQTRTAGEAYDQAQQAKEEAKQQAQQTAQQQTGTSSTGGLMDKAKNVVGSHAQDVNNARDPNASYSQQKDQMMGVAQQKKDQAQSEADRRAPGNNSAEDEAQAKKSQLMNKIPDNIRNQGAHTIDTTKEILKDKFPEERREQFIYRLKKVLVDCQEHKDYREAMEWLLDAFENYQGHAKHVARKAEDAGNDLKSEPNVAGSTQQFQTLLERFANNRSMDPIFDALDQIYTDAKNDPELSKYFTRLNEYAHRCLLDSGYVLEDECEQEGRQLQEDGKYFFTDKYKGHQENLFDQVQIFFTAMGDDPLNIRLGDDIKRLWKNLLFDGEGNLTFKPKLWNDIRNVILPMAINQLGYLPIPRCEYSDDKIDLVLENICLSGPNLIPNIITIESENRFTFSPYANINKTLDTHHHKFRLAFSQSQADIKDVAFSFRRKNASLFKSDHGLASVVISGKGISVDVELETVENRRDSLVKISHVKTDIDHMTFKISDSKHDILYKFLRATATGVIKKAIQAAINGAIRAAIENLDDQLVQIRDATEEAKKSDETTRQQALKDLYRRKQQNAQEKKEAAKEHTGTFRIVANRDSQLNPDMSGVSDEKSMAKRMWKVEDAAVSGKGWRSPAFDLLDPKHPAVTGKHHPQASPNAAAGKGLTSTIQDADAPSSSMGGNQGPPSNATASEARHY